MYLPLAVYWSILFVGTSLPSDRAITFTVSDKFQHFAAYSILSFMLSLAFLVQDKHRAVKEKYLIMAVLVSSVYGTLDEIHQIFVPGRSADVFDLIADAIGSVTGAMLFYFFNKYILR